MQDDWRDISSRALVMLFRDDPDGILAEADSKADVFVRLAELSMFHHVSGIEEALLVRFGERWRARYGEARARVYANVPPP